MSSAKRSLLSSSSAFFAISSACSPRNPQIPSGTVMSRLPKLTNSSEVPPPCTTSCPSFSFSACFLFPHLPEHTFSLSRPSLLLFLDQRRRPRTAMMMMMTMRARVSPRPVAASSRVFCGGGCFGNRLRQSPVPQGLWPESGSEEAGRGGALSTARLFLLSTRSPQHQVSPEDPQKLNYLSLFSLFPLHPFRYHYICSLSLSLCLFLSLSFSAMSVCFELCANSWCCYTYRAVHNDVQKCIGMIDFRTVYTEVSRANKYWWVYRKDAGTADQTDLVCVTPDFRWKNQVARMFVQ